MPGNNRVNVPESSWCGFWRNIKSVAIPEAAAEIDILNGNLDKAETELKLAKARYKRQYLYISGGVAATVAILQAVKYSVDMEQHENAGSQTSFNIWIDFACTIIPIAGTALAGWVHAWDTTADDHLNEIEQSRIAMPAPMV